MLHDPDTSDLVPADDSGIQTEPAAEQERFFISLDGTFDWKLPSQALKGDKDCTDTPPRMFALYIARAAEKFCKQVAPASSLVSQD